MSFQPNHFKIGLFVVLAVTFCTIGIAVLGAGKIFRKTIPMETYFNESVQGLDVGSPVKHRGVQIGRVEEITFVRDVYERGLEDEGFFKYASYVLVRCALDINTFGGLTLAKARPIVEQMVEKGLRVRLASQGLTGIGYLEVDYLSLTENPRLQIDWVPVALYVPSAPSVFNRFAMYAEEVLKELGQLDIDEIGHDLDQLLVTLDSSFKAEFSPSLAQLHKTLSRVDSILNSRQLTIEETLDNLHRVSSNLKDITENAKQNPSQFVFGAPPERVEPSR
ncbi:MAG: MCE family protein [Candidatus Omnitrophica bacterium]|nr:MCE family protein [Candidatus Omnitrophota bacterium]